MVNYILLWNFPVACRGRRPRRPANSKTKKYRCITLEQKNYRNGNNTDFSERDIGDAIPCNKKTHFSFSGHYISIKYFKEKNL